MDKGTKLKTSELGTLNSDRLIWISNVEPFDLLFTNTDTMFIDWTNIRF